MLMILARLVRSESFWAVVKVRSPHNRPEVWYPRPATTFLCGSSEGRFSQPMWLHAFPFDSQELRIELLILCRVDGPGYRLPGVESSLVDRGFAPRFQWQQTGGVHCFVDEHKANGRIFPKFGATARVARKSRFYVTNVALPTAVFSGLAFTLFAAQPSEPLERLSVPLRTPDRDVCSHAIVTVSAAEL